MKAFFHPDQLLHHPRSYFSRGMMRTPQEVPQRAEHLVAAARGLGFELRVPDDAGTVPIGAVHGFDYLRFLEGAHRRWKELPEDWGEEVISNVFVRSPNPLRGILGEAARYIADGSAPIGAHTWRSAYWSAQSAIAGAAALIGGDRRAYSICRPPGHHARHDAAGGFCFLNNAAIAAQALVASGMARVAVLDTDMHHGQGVQEIFYTRRDVLYVSIHGDPENFYPAVSGFEEERGERMGEGYNLNLPMAHGASEALFFAKLEQALTALALYRPQALVLALGFDIFERDPQAKVAVSMAGFERLGRLIGAFDIPVLVVQEGGYYLEGLEENARRFFTGLGG